MTARSDLTELLLACYRRDATAQRHMYHNWYGFATTKATPYGQNTIEVEEIVQDAFLKVFMALAREAFTGNFASYFHRIIVNAGIDYYRRSSRRRQRELTTDVHKEEGACAANTALQQLEQQDCLQLLQRLPPTSRIVFNLYVFEGYQHTDIAKLLNISEGTSRSYLFKARQTLRPLVRSYLHSNTLHNE